MTKTQPEKPKYDTTEFRDLLFRKFGGFHGSKANAARTLGLSGPYLYHICSGLHPAPKKHMKKLRNLPDYEENFHFANTIYPSFVQLGLTDLASTQWNIVRENFKKKGLTIDQIGLAVFEAGLAAALNQISGEAVAEHQARQMRRDLEDDDDTDPLAD